VDFTQSQLSQEFQLTSTAMNGKLDYLAGVFAFKEVSDDELLEGAFSRVTAADIVAPFPNTDAQATADAIRGAVIKTVNKVDNLSYAAFAQATYALTDRLSFTGGLRLTEDRRRLFRRGVALTAGVDTARMAALPGDLTTLFERSTRVSDFTPSASLSYQINDDVLAYASYNTGFKSGGFNGRAFPRVGDNSFPIEFDPEELTTYETGLKATFAGQRVALNAAAFYSIYENVQLPVLSGDPGINNVNILLLNAGESIITGGELELVVSPMANLQIRTGIGLLHDRFTDFDDPSDPNAKDRRMQFVSAYQTSTSVEYSLPLSTFGIVTARADWSTRSKQFLDATNSPFLQQGKRGLLDARLSLQLNDGATEIAVFGKNLLDREYLANGVDFTATFGQVTRFVGPPRTYGLEVRRRY
jgi:iron complex outermembrane recepter protein